MQKGLTIDSVKKLSEIRNEPNWMLEKRINAFSAFEQLPLPETHYTKIRGLDLQNITALNIESNGKAEIHGELKETIEKKEGIYGVQLDSITKDLSLPEEFKKQGIIFCDIDKALVDYPELFKKYFMTQVVKAVDGKFSALHGAFWNGGIFLYVPKGIELKIPIHILHIIKNFEIGTFNHTLIIVEEGSRITYIEESHSLNKSESYGFHTGVTEIFVGDGAEVNYGSLHNTSSGIYSFIRRKALSKRDSRVRWISGWLGGKLTISKIESQLGLPGAEVEDTQIVFGSGKQHFDLTSHVIHVSDHTKGNVLIKGIVKDKGRAVFNGLVDIEKDAFDVDTYLAEHAMLLNPGARADAIPSLQINNSNVKAGHGATVGQIDEEQIFYLMTRGLTEFQAKQLIVEGFFEPAIDKIPLPIVRERLSKLIDLKWQGETNG
jgi:FeS assembly protein SufB